MSILNIPFGKMLPDRAAFRSEGIILAKNVVPHEPGSYGPFRELSEVSNAITARCYGGTSMRDQNNNVFIYVGDSSALYENASGTFSDQSKVGGYTLLVDDVWEFASWYKNDKVIATNYNDPVQVIGTGLGGTTNFADLFTSTAKPKAKHIAVIGNFLMLGNTNDTSDGIRPSRVWWSGFGDELDMDPDAATQCDYEDLASGGWVQRIIGGTEYGLIFQTDMVRTARYAGSGVVFELLPINNAPGTPIPNSVIAHKGRVFYIAEDGFYAFNGGAVEPIGTSQIDHYFWDQFDINNKRSVSAAIDPVKKIVCWGFAGSGSVGGLPNRILMYKWDEGRWAEAEVDHEILLRTETQGYTLDGLDALGTNIDDSGVFNVSLDADKWRGGSLRFGAMTDTHKMAFFTGATRRATIETGDIQPRDGSRWQVHGVRPLIDGGSANVSVASRTKLASAVSYGVSTAMNAEGLCQVRREGRYNRFRVSLTSSMSWNHIQGIQIEFEIGGEP